MGVGLFMIHGVAQTAGGTSVVGAEIKFYVGQQCIAAVHSSATGSFSLELPRPFACGMILGVRADVGCASMLWSSQLGEVVLMFGDSCAVRFRACDSVGSAVPHARFQLAQEESTPAGRVVHKIADITANHVGEYERMLPRGGVFLVSPQVEGVLLPSQAKQTIQGEGQEIVVRIPALVATRVVAVDAMGAPVRGASVRLQNGESWGDTGPDGICSRRAAKGMWPTVFVRKPGWAAAPSNSWALLGGVPQITIKMQPCAYLDVTGSALEGDGHIAVAAVVGGRRAPASPHKFDIRGGKCTLEAEPCTQFVATLWRGGNIVGERLLMAGQPSERGKVVWGDGGDVSLVSLRVSYARSGDCVLLQWRRCLGEKGSGLLASVESWSWIGREFSLRCGAGSYVFEVWLNGVAVTSGVVDVVGDRLWDVPGKAGVYISGLVEDPKRQSREVVVIGPIGARSRRFSGVCSDGGRFNIAVDERGEYLVSVGGDGYVSPNGGSTVSTEDWGQKWVVSYEEWALVGFVPEPAGGRISRVWATNGERMFDGVVDRQGRWEVVVPARGLYTVRAGWDTDEGRVVFAQVEGIAGGMGDVVLKLK